MKITRAPDQSISSAKLFIDTVLSQKGNFAENK